MYLDEIHMSLHALDGATKWNELQHSRAVQLEMFYRSSQHAQVVAKQDVWILFYHIDVLQVKLHDSLGVLPAFAQRQYPFVLIDASLYRSAERVKELFNGMAERQRSGGYSPGRVPMHLNVHIEQICSQSSELARMAS